MFDFKKMASILQKVEAVSAASEVIEFWKRVSGISELAWTDTLEETRRNGLDSAGLEEINALIESTWYLVTMEESDGDNERENCFTPVGENLSFFELADILLAEKPVTGTGRFI